MTPYRIVSKHSNRELYVNCNSEEEAYRIARELLDEKMDALVAFNPYFSIRQRFKWICQVCYIDSSKINFETYIYGYIQLQRFNLKNYRFRKEKIARLLDDSV